MEVELTYVLSMPDICMLVGADIHFSSKSKLVDNTTCLALKIQDSLVDFIRKYLPFIS